LTKTKITDSIKKERELTMHNLKNLVYCENEQPTENKLYYTISHYGKIRICMWLNELQTWRFPSGLLMTQLDRPAYWSKD